MATGSACTSILPTPSHVLIAMGLSEAEAHSSVRISIGRITTMNEVELSALMIRNKVEQIRVS